MDERRMPSGVLLVLAGLALVGLGLHFDVEALRSIGVVGLVGGLLLLIVSRFTPG